MAIGTIKIYAQRHGERNGDDLTKPGIAQIEASKRLLADIDFKYFYASPKKRAQQTAALIAEDTLKVIVDYGLYAPLSDAQIGKIWNVLNGKNTTVRDWFLALPRDWGQRIRSQLTTTFQEMILEAQRAYPEGDIDIYACGHSLLLEMALPDEAQNIQPLDVGEIIVFTFKVDSGDIILSHTEVLRRNQIG